MIFNQAMPWKVLARDVHIMLCNIGLFYTQRRQIAMRPDRENSLVDFNLSNGTIRKDINRGLKSSHLTASTTTTNQQNKSWYNFALSIIIMRASASFFVLAAALSGFHGASGAAIPPNGQTLAHSSIHYRIGTPIQTPEAGAVKRDENAGKFWFRVVEFSVWDIR